MCEDYRLKAFSVQNYFCHLLRKQHIETKPIWYYFAFISLLNMTQGHRSIQDELILIIFCKQAAFWIIYAPVWTAATVQKLSLHLWGRKAGNNCHRRSLSYSDPIAEHLIDYRKYFIRIQWRKFIKAAFFLTRSALCCQDNTLVKRSIPI